MQKFRPSVHLIPKLAPVAKDLIWHANRVLNLQSGVPAPDAFALFSPSIRYGCSGNMYIFFHSNIIDEFTGMTQSNP